jgi:type IV pilus assembly protein PilQ
MTRMRLWLLSPALALAASLALPGAQAQQATLPPPQAGQQQEARRFTGAPIDVDYQGANLRQVLRQLSDVGGVNLVIDPSVPLTAIVDLRLTQVPWDQVLDVVLRTSQLTYLVDGAVIRVLTREAHYKELEDEARRRNASQQAPELGMVRVRLNYAPAASVKTLLETARIISNRGTVDMDERTNTLIVQDLPEKLQDIQSLIADLDKPEPQVEIEAKVIQTNRDTARALGVQWGITGRAAQEFGNTTGLTFPNTAAVTGRVQQQGQVTQGPSNVNTGVNLPVIGATSALGVTLGSISGALNLDMALSALQHEGKLEILSTPKVVTQNNIEAEVVQGFEIPIQIVANNTVSVQFKNAALILRVTPQITAANTVIMKINLENGTPDFSRAVNGNPSINTQKATTQVQVADGVTTVIGGIVQRSETTLKDETPGMGRIPLIGWLFRHSETRNESQELLIFITPRIVR